MTTTQIPFHKLSKEPLPDPCRCPECDGSCPRRIRKGWYQCNPCTKGYHFVPCPAFVEDHPAHLIHECKECGWFSEEH